MACIVEALGLMPLGPAPPPATTSARIRIAEQAGSTIVDISTRPKPLLPQDILTKASFENAITVLQALGGSTNAVVHLLAIAGRLSNLSPQLTLDDFDSVGRRTPVLVNLKPSGTQYMEDFHKAGGVPALLHRLASLLHLDAMTVTGKTLGEELKAYPAVNFTQDIVRSLEDPLFPACAIAVLKGNLAPNGCVIKQSAASQNLLHFSGPACVFTSASDLAERIDSEDLNVTAECVLVLQNIGPVGHPGMPEAGLIPIPKKLARLGVKDMLRISDGRMSGTAEGSVVLHVSPEAAIGGPLALVQDGDIISLDVSLRRITLEVGEDELDKRRSEWVKKNPAPRNKVKRGYGKLYTESVMQADQGADFSWLRADSQ